MLGAMKYQKDLLYLRNTKTILSQFPFTFRSTFFKVSLETKTIIGWIRLNVGTMSKILPY